MLDLLPLA